MITDTFSTEHAELRLMQRAREFDKSMTELWESGIDCEVSHHGYDEARVIPSHDIVMLVENNRVITILDDLHNVTIDGDNFQEYLNKSSNDSRPKDLSMDSAYTHMRSKTNND